MDTEKRSKLFAEGKKAVGGSANIAAGATSKITVQFPETPKKLLGFAFSTKAGLPAGTFVMKIKNITIIETTNNAFYDRDLLTGQEYFYYEYPLDMDSTIIYEVTSAAGGNMFVNVIYV